MKLYQKRTVTERPIFSFGITISTSKKIRLKPSTWLKNVFQKLHNEVSNPKAEAFLFPFFLLFYFIKTEWRAGEQDAQKESPLDSSYALYTSKDINMLSAWTLYVENTRDLPVEWLRGYIKNVWDNSS
jgi:hypothetical protein